MPPAKRLIRGTYPARSKDEAVQKFRTELARYGYDPESAVIDSGPKDVGRGVYEIMYVRPERRAQPKAAAQPNAEDCDGCEAYDEASGCAVGNLPGTCDHSMKVNAPKINSDYKPAPTPAPTSAPIAGPSVVPVRDVLITGWNPRKRFDEEALRELAASIEAIGLLEPVLVRPKGSKYELVVGERRLRAFRLLKRELIPAVVREMSDEEVLDAMLAENVCREDLDPIEEANALKRALEVSKLSQAEFGRRVGRFGKSQEWVAQRIKLTEAPPELQEEIIRRRIKPSAVVEILQQKGNNNYQSTLDDVLALAKVQDEVTVREVREIIRTYRPAPKPVVDVERLRQGTEFMEPDVIEIPEEKPQVEEPEDLPEERKASPEVEKEPASEDEPDPDDPGIDRSERRVITREQFEETSTTWDDLKEPAPRPWRDVKARYGQMPSSNTAKRELLEWAFPWLKEGGA